MKYCIIYFHSGQIKSDFGQNGGFDTITAAIEHAQLVGIQCFIPMPFGDGDYWAAVEKKTTPSVSTKIDRAIKTTKTNDSKGNGAK